MRFRLPLLFIVLMAAALLAKPFEAAALITPTGTAANTSTNATFAPASIWDNVGVAGDSTGEYLGNGWIITANHVSRSGNNINFSLTLGVTTYNWLGTGTRLGSHDIFLAQLSPDGSGNLPDAYGATGVPLATSTPSTTTSTIMIGGGRTISATTYYTVSGNTWTQDTNGNSSTPNEDPVYSWGPSRLKTWGTNNIWGTTAAGSFGTLGGDNALAVDFSASGNYSPSTPYRDVATSSETGAALNDSGGGMFVQEGGNWKLAGLLVGIDNWLGQPTTTSDGTPSPLPPNGVGQYTTTVGDDTYAIDLSSYASQINEVIATPEPSSIACLALGLAVLGARRNRKR